MGNRRHGSSDQNRIRVDRIAQRSHICLELRIDRNAHGFDIEQIARFGESRICRARHDKLGRRDSSLGARLVPSGFERQDNAFSAAARNVAYESSAAKRLAAIATTSCSKRKRLGKTSG